MERAAQVLQGRAIMAVASGGAFPAARLAARLHTERTGKFAQALTPLGYVAGPVSVDPTSLLLASATARHPDTELAVKAAIWRGHRILLVTQRKGEELTGLLRHPSVSILTIPRPHGRDGFLATQSLLATCTVLGRLYSSTDKALPETLPSFSVDAEPLRLRERVLILFAPDEQPIADDLEARLAESGIAAVQLADYRVFAHGRHYGFFKNLDQTTIVAVVGELTQDLAERTLSVLPPSAEIVRLQSEIGGLGGVLDLLVRSMHLPRRSAEDQRVQLHRPGVPGFGRQLYHMRASLSGDGLSAPLDRKLRAAGLPPDSEAGAWYAGALEEWLDNLASTRLGAFVFDYDGTVVSTEGRYSLPVAPVKDAITRLLAAGIPVAFASGRGDSLHRDLRKWVPQQFWPEVLLGLHNGAWQIKLSDEPVANPTLESDPSRVLGLAAARLRGIAGIAMVVRESPTQVSVRASDALVGPDVLYRLAVSVVQASPSLDVRVASSAHSVDITHRTSGKHLVVDRLNAEYGEALAVGDQGEPTGNDFQLLASTPWSLSVDRCSPDPSRCWALAPPGTTGPAALLALLAAVSSSRRGHRFLPGRLARHVRPPAGR